MVDVKNVSRFLFIAICAQMPCLIDRLAKLIMLHGDSAND